MAFMADSLRIAGGRLLVTPGGKLSLTDECCCQHVDCFWACCEKDGEFRCLRADAPMFDCCGDIGGTTHGFFIGPCTESCEEAWGACPSCPPPPPCSGPCSEENPCPEGCYCCNGVCQSEPCPSACCIPDRCTVEADVDFTGSAYEGGPFPTPAGWANMGALLPEFANIIHYIHVIPSTEPCDDQSQYYADLVTAFFAWLSGLGMTGTEAAFSSVSQQSASCQDGLTQAACEAQGGTHITGQPCNQDPCSAVFGVCCVSGGVCQSGLTQAECEACVPTNTCYEYMTLANPEDSCPAGWTPDGFGGCSRMTTPASCNDCAGYCFTTNEGNCGTWVPGATCDSSPCCAYTGDCPEFDPDCPDIPMACCGDVCTPHSCFPGIWIKMTFTKPASCDPALYPGLANVATGAQFDVVISGGTLVCEDFADLSSAPCNTTWRLSRGCILSNFNFDIVNTQYPQACADCYSQLDSWSYGRNDPTGATATPPGSWEPCP